MSCICMYTPSADGGHARYAWELTTALARSGRGYRFELVSGRDLHEQFRSSAYRVHAILPPLADRSTFSTRLSWGANRLTHYFRREYQFLRWLRTRPDIDAVHFQESASWLAAPLFRRVRALGKKIFYTAHNIVPHRCPPGVPRPLMQRWARNAWRLCDGLFVHTPLLRQELSRMLGPGHPPIQVVPHGVWTVPDGLVPSLDERLAYRRLLFFGAIRRNKGLDLLLRAAARLPDYRITIAGHLNQPVYFREEIVPLIDQAREQGARIELIQRFIPDADVPGLFASHSAIVLPYTRDFVAQSGVVFLAIAHQLPVVASEAGGLRELLGQFRLGTTFGESSPAALAEAVRALEADELRQALPAHMRAARERFSWDDAAAATMAGYSAAFTTSTVEDDCFAHSFATR